MSSDVVECWHWLLSACPRQELVFLQEMISAWHHTRAAKLGLFSDDTQTEQVTSLCFLLMVKTSSLSGRPSGSDRGHGVEAVSSGNRGSRCLDQVPPGEDRGGQVLQPGPDRDVLRHAPADTGYSCEWSTILKFQSEVMTLYVFALLRLVRMLVLCQDMFLLLGQDSAC